MSTNQLLLLLMTGLIAGLVSGAMGVGGAIIIVPFLVFFLGMSQHEAQGTSLAVLLMPVGIFAVMNYAKNSYVNYKFAAVVVIAFLLGSYIGSKVAIQLPERTLQRVFAGLLIAVGLKILIWK